MPKCLNDSSKRYTGNENTPKGKGYVASGEKVGKRMKGNDGNMYVVTKKGKTKRWEKISKKPNNSQLSPMSKRARKKKRKTRKKKDQDYSSSEDEEDYSSSEDEEDIEWKLKAAEDRCKLSDVLCSDYLLVSAASLAWKYFKDWYQRVHYGEDPYKAYEDVSLLS